MKLSAAEKAGLVEAISTCATEGDVVQVLWSLEQAMEELGVVEAQGQALAAAGRVMAGEKAPALA